MSQPTKTDKYLSAAAVVAALLVGGYATMQVRPKPRTDVPPVQAVPIAAGRTVAMPKPKPSASATVEVVLSPSPTATPYDDAKAFLAESDKTDVIRIEKDRQAMEQAQREDEAMASHQTLTDATRFADFRSSGHVDPAAPMGVPGYIEGNPLVDSGERYVPVDDTPPSGRSSAGSHRGRGKSRKSSSGGSFNSKHPRDSHGKFRKKH